MPKTLKPRTLFLKSTFYSIIFNMQLYVNGCQINSLNTGIVWCHRQLWWAQQHQACAQCSIIHQSVLVFTVFTQYFVEAPLAGIQPEIILCMMLQALHIYFWYFLKFFFAELLSLLQVGWRIILSHFQISPKMFNHFEVWVLARSLKDIHRVVLKNLFYYVGCVFGVVVLLEDEPSPQSEV